jgi:hypothetical protein
VEALVTSSGLKPSPLTDAVFIGAAPTTESAQGADANLRECPGHQGGGVELKMVPTNPW